MNKILVGSKIRFHRGDNKVCDDVVRGLFIQEILLEPYARNQRKEAAILTEHSWCFIEDIVFVDGAEPKAEPRKSRKIKALPDYDVVASKVPAFRKVFYADQLGRIMRDACDVFATRDQACVYWWMLARQGVRAFIDAGMDGQYSNAHLSRAKEPPELVESIDWAEAEYSKEGDPEPRDESVFKSVRSIFDVLRP